MTENNVHFLAENDLGRFSTARFWLGPGLDWQSPNRHLMGFLRSSSLDSHKARIPCILNLLTHCTLVRAFSQRAWTLILSRAFHQFLHADSFQGNGTEKMKPKMGPKWML